MTQMTERWKTVKIFATGMSSIHSARNGYRRLSSVDGHGRVHMLLFEIHHSSNRNGASKKVNPSNGERFIKSSALDTWRRDSPTCL